MQKKKAYSLLDFAVAMLIFSILLAIFLPRWEDYNRWLSSLKTQFGFEEQYVVFRIQLEEDFYNALLHTDSLIDNLKYNFQMESWTIKYSTNRFEKKTCYLSISSRQQKYKTPNINLRFPATCFTRSRNFSIPIIYRFRKNLFEN